MLKMFCEFVRAYAGGVGRWGEVGRWGGERMNVAYFVRCVVLVTD